MSDYVSFRTFRLAITVLGLGIVGLASLWFRDHDKLTTIIANQVMDTDLILKAISELIQ